MPALTHCTLRAAQEGSCWRIWDLVPFGLFQLVNWQLPSAGTAQEAAGADGWEHTGNVMSPVPRAGAWLCLLPACAVLGQHSSQLLQSCWLLTAQAWGSRTCCSWCRSNAASKANCSPVGWWLAGSWSSPLFPALAEGSAAAAVPGASSCYFVHQCDKAEMHLPCIPLGSGTHPLLLAFVDSCQGPSSAAGCYRCHPLSDSSVGLLHDWQQLGVGDMVILYQVHGLLLYCRKSCS